jgi:hypothetical protein
MSSGWCRRHRCANRLVRLPELGSVSSVAPSAVQMTSPLLNVEVLQSRLLVVLSRELAQALLQSAARRDLPTLGVCAVSGC